MHFLKAMTFSVMFLFAYSAMAGSSLYASGTIKSVDVKNNTFTVELENSGDTKTYSFPDSINFTDDGVALVDKSAFKEGQPVKLMFETKKPMFSNPVTRTQKEYILKSMTVN